MQRFERIYAEHYEAVLAYVRRRAPESAVDDVVSDTFVVCLRKIDGVPAEPLPWLYAVARKTLANDRRKRSRVAHGYEVAASGPDPVGDGALAVAFTALSERDREVLRLVAWEGLSLADKQSINKALLRSGASIDEMNCVRKHLSRIKGGRLAAAAFPARTFSGAELSMFATASSEFQPLSRCTASGRSPACFTSHAT